MVAETRSCNELTEATSGPRSSAIVVVFSGASLQVDRGGESCS